MPLSKQTAVISSLSRVNSSNRSFSVSSLSLFFCGICTHSKAINLMIFVVDSNLCSTFDNGLAWRERERERERWHGRRSGAGVNNAHREHIASSQISHNSSRLAFFFFFFFKDGVSDIDTVLNQSLFSEFRFVGKGAG